MPPAARLTDFHQCPMQTPAVPAPIPHVGGPIAGPGAPTVLIGGLPAAKVGDIAICAPLVKREAAAQGKSIEAHWSHLVVHGVLHLAGYDHVHSDEEAEAMEALEIAALAKLGIADPYGDRDLKE